MTAEREPFEAFFAREIAPALESKEALRQQAVRWRNIALGAGGGLAVLILAVALARGGLSPPVIIVAVIVAGLGYGVGYAILATAATSVKDAFVAEVAGYAGARFSRYVADTSSIFEFQKHRLVPAYDRSSFEDRLEGEEAGCPFELYEAHLKKRHTDSKGRSRYVTCFRGQLLRVLVPMEFLGVTVVLRDAGLFNGFQKPSGDLKRVGLVDPKFERTFEVFSTDQVEARYLLTPDFMERLLHLEDRLKGKKARAAFADGELLIAMEGGNLFEAGSMLTPLVDPARAERILDEIATIRGIIGALLAAKAQSAG